MVPEIPGRCVNKPSNRAIILKQKVTSGVTTGPEINKDPNYQQSTGPIFGDRLPAVRKMIRFQVGFIPSVQPGESWSYQLPLKSYRYLLGSHQLLELNITFWTLKPLLGSQSS